ncbi:hypothetical protein [Herbaspirillum sp. SJZ107]|uniref:hypothetical protein n=1 Tax=Herbaspirillum sp. SJZ107 TaxID=2572881 RepID=UPI001154DACE|nr:hypothetical protein [Herbaspirillum sp. SJZ107]TQK10224.1 hypothetical protein FBX97_0140 [Herbaspirillum sp. SJZ107]
MRDYSPLRGLAAANPTVHLKSTTVIELLDELDRLRAGGAAPAKVKRNDYPADFEAVWEVYPARPGDSKKAAHKAWASRIKAGATVAEMLVGAQAYAAYVKVMRTEPQFILQSATFFGPSERYAADWTPPAQQPKPAGGGAWWLTDATRLAKANEVGVGAAHYGESTASWEARIRAAIDNGGKPPAPPRLAQIVTPPPAPPVIEQAPEAPRRVGRPEGLTKMLKDLGHAA